MTRALGVAVALAAATVALWSLVFPADWSVVPTADPLTAASPVTSTHWAVAAAGLVLLAGVGGYVRGVGVALLGVAVPALALYCYRSATAEVIGANLWLVGALFLAPALATGVAIAAAVGHRVGRRRVRT